jgi:hypothetical protein
MQMRLFPALILFLGSYFPLSLILLIQDVKESSWKAPLCSISEVTSCVLPELANPIRALVLLVVCAISLCIFMVLMKNLSGHSELEVVDSKSVPNDLINYVFPYVVSFMGLDLGVDGKFFGFLLFIVLMFVITYRSGQILMNPFLLVAGWQLYELNIVTEQHKRCVRALSKEQIKSGDHLESCLVHGIYVLHRGDK